MYSRTHSQFSLFLCCHSSSTHQLDDSVENEEIEGGASVSEEGERELSVELSPQKLSKYTHTHTHARFFSAFNK
jgi:hypothetical protein